MSKKITIIFVIGLIISIATLYLAFKNVPFAELVNYLLSINYFWILPTTVLILISFVIRAIRWQFILGSHQHVSFRHAFHPLMIGFMINCVLPGRVGEVARPAILKKKENVPFTTGLATVAAERVFDVGILIILFVTLFSQMEIDPALGIPFGDYTLNSDTLTFVFKGLLRLSILLLVGIALISLQPTRKAIEWCIKSIPDLFFFAGPKLKDKLQKRIAAPLLAMLDNIAAGFVLLKQPMRVAVCLLFSIVIWALHAFSYYIFALGCPGIALTFFELAAVMIIICFFIALPSAPGYWGLWEAGGVFAMLLFGVSFKEAAGFTLANHAIQLIPVILVGLVSALITGVNIWQVSFAKR
ncbi:MAG: lysylphosphatidylglycerol synthase transmembrane domain-containing protein [Planctomycetota bacterium]|jgi:uncharacterized protein (TIRG00374 family)